MVGAPGRGTPSALAICLPCRPLCRLGAHGASPVPGLGVKAWVPKAVGSQIRRRAPPCVALSLLPPGGPGPASSGAGVRDADDHVTVLRDGVTEPPLLQACQEGLKQPGGGGAWDTCCPGAVGTPALGGDIRGTLGLQGLRPLGRVSGASGL